MADIQRQLDQIMEAVLGEHVRGSIHDAIETINNVSEQIFLSGSEDPTGTAVYSKLLYLNYTTWDLFQSADTSPYTWSKIGNLEGNAITSITGPVPDETDPLKDVYTINFSKAGPVTFAVENGKGIVSITGPISNVLTDTYTITYNDGTTQTYDINNGKGIVSISGPVSSGLVDTYTITYNDGTTQDYTITNGKDGVTWYRGIKILNKDINPTIFNDSDVAMAKEGDFYLNWQEGAIYHCVVGGPPTVAAWSFDFTISGGGSTGVQNLDDLSDVIFDPNTGPSANDFLKYDGTNWTNSSLPAIDQTYAPNSTAAASGKAIANAIDQSYDPTSAKAQSGVAVKEMIDKNSYSYTISFATQMASGSTITIPQDIQDGGTINYIYDYGLNDDSVVTPIADAKVVDANTEVPYKFSSVKTVISTGTGGRPCGKVYIKLAEALPAGKRIGYIVNNNHKTSV